MQKSKYYSITKSNGNYNVVIKKAIIPLFRYRNFNQYSLSDLINDEITFSTPDNFNDPYDCSVVYDSNVIKEIQDNFYKKTNFYIQKQYIYEFIELIKNFTKNINGIVCLSETITNELMWAHYASCGKGFALEYEYNDLEKLSCEYEKIQRLQSKCGVEESFFTEDFPLKHIGPVVYDNRKYNISNTIREAVNYGLNNEILENQKQKIESYIISKEKNDIKSANETIIYSKAKDWQYEKEWRLIASVPNYQFRSGYFSLKGAKTKNIYLGEFIDEKSQQILIKIAKDKQINIYKMYSQILPSSIKLKYKKIK